MLLIRSYHLLLVFSITVNAAHQDRQNRDVNTNINNVDKVLGLAETCIGNVLEDAMTFENCHTNDHFKDHFDEVLGECRLAKKNISKILSDMTNITVNEVGSDGAKYEPPNAFFYLLNAVLLILIALAISASIFDYWFTAKEMDKGFLDRPGWKALMSFSIPRSTLTVFSLKQHPDSILCLDALRFISFTWIVNGHAWRISADEDHGLQLFRDSNYFLSSALINGFASVDTFFLISGMVVSYTFFKRVHKDPSYAYSRYNWIMYYVHRWLRLTPAFMLFVGVFSAWVPRFQGVWAQASQRNAASYVNNCVKNWWLDVFYISNIISMKDMCYGLSWYLTVDFQLYCVAPIVMLAIFYSWKSGLIAVICGALLSPVMVIIQVVSNDLPGVLFVAFKHMMNNYYMDFIHTKPWARGSDYLIGIVCGYFIAQVRTKRMEIRQLKPWEIIAGWLLSITMALTVVFGPYDYISGHIEWSITVRALYAASYPIAWSASVAWVILACTTFDCAGPVKSILEYPLWYPLGRLSYCAYIVHWFLIRVLQNVDPVHFTSLWHVYTTVAIPSIVFSYGMAYVWTCLVEIPFQKIEVIGVDLLTRKLNIHQNNTKNAVNGARPEVSLPVNKENGTAINGSIEVENHLRL